MRAYTQGKSHARPSALAASKVKEREFLRPANELLLRSGSALPPKKLVFRVACAIFCLYSGAYYLVYSCCTSDFNWRTDIWRVTLPNAILTVVMAQYIPLSDLILSIIS